MERWPGQQKQKTNSRTENEAYLPTNNLRRGRAMSEKNAFKSQSLILKVVTYLKYEAEENFYFLFLS